jgi:hypothetical protein
MGNKRCALRRTGSRLFFSGFFHRCLKAANALAEAFAQLRQFLRTEDKKGDADNDEHNESVETVLRTLASFSTGHTSFEALTRPRFGSTERQRDQAAAIGDQ